MTEEEVMVERFKQIREICRGILMKPPSDGLEARPIKWTSKQAVYDAMYKIQELTGAQRFYNPPSDCESCRYYNHDDDICTAFECNGIECPKLPCEESEDVD